MPFPHPETRSCWPSATPSVSKYGEVNNLLAYSVQPQLLFYILLIVPADIACSISQRRRCQLGILSNLTRLDKGVGETSVTVFMGIGVQLVHVNHIEGSCLRLYFSKPSQSLQFFPAVSLLHHPEGVVVGVVFINSLVQSLNIPD